MRFRSRIGTSSIGRFEETLENCGSRLLGVTLPFFSKPAEPDSWLLDIAKPTLPEDRCLRKPSAGLKPTTPDLLGALGGVAGAFAGGVVAKELTRRRMARERRGAGSSLVSMETQF